MNKLPEDIEKRLYEFTRWHTQDEAGYKKLRQFLFEEIKKAREDGEISGAKKMLDFIVLSGFEIDGVDYLKLDSVFERAEYLLNELK